MTLLKLPGDINSKETMKFRLLGGGVVVAITQVDGSTGGLVSRPQDFEGSPVTVGTTAVEMTFAGTTQSILIQSDPDNTGRVFIGKANVTNAGANAMVQLEPGDGLEMNLNDISNGVYAVSDTASQNVFKMATL